MNIPLGQWSNDVLCETPPTKVRRDATQRVHPLSPAPLRTLTETSHISASIAIGVGRGITCGDDFPVEESFGEGVDGADQYVKASKSDDGVFGIYMKSDRLCP